MNTDTTEVESEPHCLSEEQEEVIDALLDAEFLVWDTYNQAMLTWSGRSALACLRMIEASEARVAECFDHGSTADAGVDSR